MAKQSLRYGGFKAPFHLVLSKDRLRPALCQAHFLNGYVYATDANVLIRQSLVEFHGIEEEQAKILEGKRLNESKLRILWDAETVEFKPDGIEFKDKLGAQMRMGYDTNDDKVPDFEKAIPRAYVEGGLQLIGINPITLARLQKAMDVSNGAMSLHFAGRSKAIAVQHINISPSVSYGLIMPLMVPDEDNAKFPS
jgi:hypothetical protein